MNKYEALFIFGETVPDERVKEMSAYVVGEIEKLGGKVTGTREVGRRAFARTMQKTETGFYLAVTFQMAGDQITALNARYRLSDDIFRVQIIKLTDAMAKKTPPVSAPAASRYERSDRYERHDRGESGGQRYDRGDRSDRGDRAPAASKA